MSTLKALFRGFYVVRSQPPRGLVGWGFIVETVPPFRHGEGIVVRLPFGFGGFQFGWGRPKPPYLDATPQEIAKWTPPLPRQRPETDPSLCEELDQDIVVEYHTDDDGNTNMYLNNMNFDIDTQQP